MGMVVIIRKPAGGIICAPSQHSAGRLIRLDCTPRVSTLLPMAEPRGPSLAATHLLSGSVWTSLTLLFIRPRLSRVRCVAAQHLLVLVDLDALSLDHMHILESAEDLVLDAELCLHAELGALLDLEWLLLEVLERAGRRQVDGDVGATGDFERQGLNHALARVRGVDGEGGAGAAEAERGFPFCEGFVGGVEGGVFLGRLDEARWSVHW